VPRWENAQTIRGRLEKEVGRLEKSAAFTIGLCYPSPYRVGMSSLGYQQIYKLIQGRPGMACERFFLPDDAEAVSVAPLSYEGLRPLRDFPVLAFSVAYELELAGLIQMLEASSIPSLRSERGDSDPFVLAGGPLTFSNPLPLAGFADAIVMGEADTLAIDVLRVLRSRLHASRRARRPRAAAARLRALAPTARRCPRSPSATTRLLPAWAPSARPRPSSRTCS
jgi:hypothetical protein